jgi:hypothetical protein
MRLDHELETVSVGTQCLWREASAHRRVDGQGAARGVLPPGRQPPHDRALVEAEGSQRSRIGRGEPWTAMRRTPNRSTPATM